MEKVIVIVGPTGVGKTNLSIALAQQFHGEIISGDSMQVYQKMSIGTAKVTEAEKQGIPHHLVDFCHFTQEYNVKIFQEKARAAIQEIQERKALPILCGGTGLYIKSCLYDYEFLDQPQDTAFQAFLQERSEDELWSMLQVIDKEACANLHPHNRQRIVRALMIAHSGNKKSAIVSAQKHEPLYDVFIIGLTMDRTHLYERINERVDRMMEEGLLDEIRQLVAFQEDVWSLQSFQGIGYKEWKAYFDGEASIEECVEKIKKNSRNFAKRQYTWFKNQMPLHWYDVEQHDVRETILKDVMHWLET